MTEKRLENANRKVEILEKMIEDSTRDLFLANEQLKDQLSLFGALLQHTNVAVIVVMQDGRVRHANKGFCELFDLNKAMPHVVGQFYKDVVDQSKVLIEDEGAFVGRIRETEDAQQLLLDEEVRFKDGKIYERDFIPVFGEDKKLLACMWAYRDITRRKKIESQLFQSQKMEGIGVLAAGVAHDFNNILTAILSCADTVSKDVKKCGLDLRYIDAITQSAQRAASLTRQLLAFSRRQVLKPTFFDINEELNTMAMMLRRTIGEDIEFTFIAGSNIPRLRMDRAQLEQVILNVVVNARDAMPQGGKLTIETKRLDVDEKESKIYSLSTTGSHVVISITDNGVGMKEEVKRHIFEPFFTTKDVGKGTGLGLAMAYGIVKQSNGNMMAYSEPGVGTTFRIFFPCSTDEMPSQVLPLEMDAKGKEAPGGDETIFVVEDDASVRENIERILKTAGYTVFVAENPNRALEMFSELSTPVDLVLTDVIMPGMNGRALIEKLKSKLSDTPVLYMSGYSGDAISHSGVLDRDINFLEKPFTPQVLKKTVRDVLDGIQ